MKRQLLFFLTSREMPQYTVHSTNGIRLDAESSIFMNMPFSGNDSNPTY